MRKKICSSLIVFVFIQYVCGEEAICTVNTKTALHTVSERFLSTSIDPVVLLTGLNLSDTSLQLAKKLSPAFIRIAGPSTRYVQYVDTDDKSSEHSSEDVANIIVTPSMWFGINEWLSLANLTPIFGINDFETAKGVWNPKSTLPLLEISDKFNVTCYWQLGYDCSNKTAVQYQEDLSIFRHILDAFVDKKNIWKIVGSDPRKCSDIESSEVESKILYDLRGTLDAVVWEAGDDKKEDVQNILGNDFMTLQQLIPHKPDIPKWKSVAKTSHSISFLSALAWAKEIGESAKNGFGVVFRQPRLHELSSATPVYWVSVLHKNLMGRNALDVKTATQPTSISVYAHCSKKQNSFVRSGAITVLVINNGPNNLTTLVRFGNSIMKNMEVQSYTLTSEDEKSPDIYLNGNKLNMQNFEEHFIPKLRRAKIVNYLSLSLPGKSIGFFVLPDAQAPVCIAEETDSDLLMEEIYEDQHIPFAQEMSVDFEPRIKSNKLPTLRELQQNMEHELQSDEKYYKDMRPPKKYFGIKENPKLSENKVSEARNYFIERARLADKQRKQAEVGHNRLEIRPVVVKEKKEEPRRELELELTSAEIRKVLSDRAKVKAAKKNIKFTSQELEEIMKKATQRYLRNSNIKIKPKFKRSVDPPQRSKKDINMKLLKLKSLGQKQKVRVVKSKKLDKLSHHANKTAKREKRDINLDLLKLKTELLQSTNKNKTPFKRHFDNKEEKQATIRTSDQTSDELLRELDELSAAEEEQDFFPKSDIFAELANSAQSQEKDADLIDRKPILPELILKPKPQLLSTLKPVSTKLEIKLPVLKSDTSLFKKKIVEKPKLLKDIPETGKFENSGDSELDIDDTDGEQFTFIHEFIGPQIQINNRNNEDHEITELWEIADLPTEENKTDHGSQLENRGVAAGGDESLQEANDSHNPLKTLDKLLTSIEAQGKDEPEFLTDYEGLDIVEEPLRIRRDINTINTQTTNSEGFRALLDPLYNQIDDNLKSQQINMIKKRLWNKKVFDMFYKTQDPNMIGRTTRSILEIGDSSINHRYKSLTDGLKIWKPQDIMNLKHNTVSRSKRNVEFDINSLENEIDSPNFINEIIKDAKIVDMHNGDYQLIFPNKDKIEVSQNPEDTEVKFVLHGEQAEKVTESLNAIVKFGDNSKSESSSFTTESTTQLYVADEEYSDIKNNIQTIVKDVQNVTNAYSNVVPNNFWKDVLVKIGHFFQNLGTQFKQYMTYFSH